MPETAYSNHYPLLRQEREREQELTPTGHHWAPCTDQGFYDFILKHWRRVFYGDPRFADEMLGSKVTDSRLLRVRPVREAGILFHFLSCSSL